ncbi:BRO-A [Spodoptera eridania nucleopolyhedrovirus]|uniref:BRO-A n=1 Tax=Spodoptera eridania nucleopolyhedrovirus TaxID=2315721 RepID=A0A346TQ10_9ABAC|nr:BRO-A [Spodoptera eridania nucleopolyhedrovirus]AXU41670.1 BRO-A [Spodoptera eridania nucleopolyhedrovirus]
MSIVKVGFFSFGGEEFELRYIINNHDMQVYFVAKDIATLLKYENTKKAVTDHVDEKYKMVYSDDSQPESVIVNNLLVHSNILYLHPQTVLINKSGVIQLIMKSKLSYAVELQEWLLEEVIPQVLCTGKYSASAALTTTAAADNNSGIVGNEIVKQFQTQIQKKDDHIQNLIVQINRLTDNNNAMVKKLMNNVNEMYGRLHETVSKSNEIMLQKDKQINKLLDKLDDVAERAVKYPADDKKVPMICIGRKDNNFEVITGQQHRIQREKLKRGFNNLNIIVETKRPNPMLDWMYVTQSVKKDFPKESLKRGKRSLSFENSDDAERFDSVVKKMFVSSGSNHNNSLLPSSSQQSEQTGASVIQAH